MRLRALAERRPKERATSVLHPEAGAPITIRRSDKVIELLRDRGIRGIELRDLPLTLALVVNRDVLKNQKTKFRNLQLATEDEHVGKLGESILYHGKDGDSTPPTPSPKMVEVVVKAAVGLELVFLETALLAGVAYPEKRTELINKLREHLDTLTTALSKNPQSSQDPMALAALMRLLQLVPDKKLAELVTPFWDSWVAEEERLLNRVSNYDDRTAASDTPHLITVSLALEVLEADEIHVGGDGVPHLRQKPRVGISKSLPDRLVA